MRNRSSLALVALLAAVAPGAARADASQGAPWSLTVTAWAGLSRYDVLGLPHGVAAVGSQERRDLIDGNFNALGAEAVLRIRWFEAGLLYEGTLIDRGAGSEVVTPLVGFAWDFGRSFRLDALAELGGHRITRIGTGNDLVTGTGTVWLPSFGVRPSISWRMPLGPVRLVAALTPFARWDIVRKTVSVSTTSPDTRTTYEAGGSTFGVVGGVGFEI